MTDVLFERRKRSNVTLMFQVPFIALRAPTLSWQPVVELIVRTRGPEFRRKMSIRKARALSALCLSFLLCNLLLRFLGDFDLERKINIFALVWLYAGFGPQQHWNPDPRINGKTGVFPRAAPRKWEI